MIKIGGLYSSVAIECYTAFRCVQREAKKATHFRPSRLSDLNPSIRGLIHHEHQDGIFRKVDEGREEKPKANRENRQES